MSETLAVVLVLVSAGVVWLWLAFAIAKYAERNGQSFLGFFLLGLFVSPIVALIGALILRDRAPGNDVAQ